MMVVEAPAKVNLWLRVLGKRADGFHELETLMVPVAGLADRLEFVPGEAYQLECATPGVPLDETNLVSKAVRVFERATGRVCRYRVTLHKEVPHGAGLGGGSSDAAATLRALDAMEGTRLGTAQLAELAAGLGSDVAFFLFGQACVCRGRGELVEPVSLDLPHRLLLLKPEFAVATPDAYHRWAGAPELPGVDYAHQRVGALELFNDLERPVFSKHLFLAEMKLWLRAQPGVAAALMSGSGSTMFAVLDNSADPDAILANARRELDPTLWGKC